VLEDFYRSIGEDLHKRVQFVRLEPNYRLYFHDGSQLDLHNSMAELANAVERLAPGNSTRVFRFLGDAAIKYELAMEFVTRNYRYITDLINPKAMGRLLRTRAYQNLYAQVSRFFDADDKLSKAFSFHSMFLGLSPFEAPAMYSLITYADLALGMWFPRGGIYRLVEDLVQLAEERGIILRANAPVAEIMIERGRVAGVRLESGERVSADIVVSNADLPYTYRHLIAPAWRRAYSDRRLGRMRYACSGYILFLGVNKIYPELPHQSIYFAQDYRANLEAIFRTHSLPEDPSFHLNHPTATDTSLAPPGHSLLYILAPMPNLRGNRIDWSSAAPIVRNRLLDTLERILDPDIRQHIVWERDYRPSDWERDINAVYGTAFGSLAHDFFQSSYFRPHNKSYEVSGLYFVGQGTYPGIGIPMVIISAGLVTERILQEWS
jgi:phytoene desaturase